MWISTVLPIKVNVGEKYIVIIYKEHPDKKKKSQRPFEIVDKEQKK